jgi:hypothetical protein
VLGGSQLAAQSVASQVVLSSVELVIVNTAAARYTLAKVQLMNLHVQ